MEQQETNLNNNIDLTAFDDAGFFTEDRESLLTKETKGETNPDLYRISLDMETVKNKTYSARGRFVRDLRWKDANGKHTGKYHKKMYYLTDPTDTSKKFYAECPSNWGVPTSQNIVSSAFFKLRETDSVSLKRIANQNFGQIQFWWALFQILIDEQQPALQGKVKILRFGKPMNIVIEGAINGKPELGKVGLDVFHPFRGKDFFLNVFEKTVEDKDKGGSATKKFPSYERSSFDDEITAMMIDGKRVKDDPEGRKAVLTYLNNNAPELKQMEITKWDEATEQKVMESMRVTLGDDDLFNQIINDARKGVRRSRVVVSKETQEKMDNEAKANGGNLNSNTKAGGEGWQQPANNGGAAASQTSEKTPTEEASFSNAGGDDGLPNIETEDFGGGIE